MALISTAVSTANARQSAFVNMVGAAVGGSGNILQMLDSAAMPSDGATWPAAVGPSGAPLDTKRAVPTDTLGYRAAVFTQYAGFSSAYSAPTNVKTAIVVARYDGTTGPLTANMGLVGGQSIRLLSGTGLSTWVASGTIYKDGSVNSTIDNSAHAWIVTSVTADTNPYGIGGAYNSVAYTWNGPIWFSCLLSSSMSVEQVAAITSLLKQRFPFLP